MQCEHINQRNQVRCDCEDIYSGICKFHMYLYGGLTECGLCGAFTTCFDGFCSKHTPAQKKKWLNEQADEESKAEWRLILEEEKNEEPFDGPGLDWDGEDVYPPFDGEEYDPPALYDFEDPGDI